MAVHAFIFPGQGSQSVGMGSALAKAFPVARELFEEVDDALSQKLSALMFAGPAEELTLTENAQPALMAVSMAVLRVLEREGGVVVRDRVSLVAGHSLGEYSALAAAGSLGVAQAARLLRLRGSAMQLAVPAGLGAMAALIGTDMAGAQAVCDEAAILRVEGQPDKHQTLEVANDNGGGQVVISGVREAVERAIVIAKEHKIKRAVLLPVSAPFHCSMMAPAAEAMGEALSRVTMGAPVVPLVANVTAAKVTDPATIADLLVRQVTGTVRWRESVETMATMGVDSFVELGSGKVLSGLVKRINGDVSATSVGTPEDVEQFLRSF